MNAVFGIEVRQSLRNIHYYLTLRTLRTLRTLVRYLRHSK